MNKDIRFANKSWITAQLNSLKKVLEEWGLNGDQCFPQNAESL